MSVTIESIRSTDLSTGHTTCTWGRDKCAEVRGAFARGELLVVELGLDPHEQLMRAAAIVPHVELVQHVSNAFEPAGRMFVRGGSRAKLDATIAYAAELVGMAAPVWAHVPLRDWHPTDELRVLDGRARPSAIAVGDRVLVTPRGGRVFEATIVHVFSDTYGLVEDDGNAWIVEKDLCTPRAGTAASTPAEVPAEHECPVCSGDARTCGHAPCGACAGTGGAACSDCRGTGEYVGMHEITRCSTCAGAGKIVCEPCGGSGW